ncbi:MAG: response regulator transcription factor [Candidatus Sericytochromatia bacterium]|nr:response regulator transcription factor [Candidatus Tanganyikabacteria bacterium]
MSDGTTPAGPKILIIEDDREISGIMAMELGFEGYAVSVEADGFAGLAAAARLGPDLVILDCMLPGLDGVEVCQRLRSVSDVPIVMLTARGRVADRVRGLDSGADDYVVKPFDLEELLARIRAQLRKHTAKPVAMKVGDLEMDQVAREVRRGSMPIHLSVKEWDLLAFLMRNTRQVLSRERILQEVWNYDFGGDSNILDVYVRYLRQKIEAPGKPKLLHTVRGVGYVLREE